MILATIWSDVSERWLVVCWVRPFYGWDCRVRHLPCVLQRLLYMVPMLMRPVWSWLQAVSRLV